eukprot:5086794-Prymnesium_polylepis.1
MVRRSLSRGTGMSEWRRGGRWASRVRVVRSMAAAQVIFSVTSLGRPLRPRSGRSKFCSPFRVPALRPRRSG